MVHSALSVQGATGLPRLNPGHLLRPRLSKALLEADCQLRLLCAPPGSGKSALLAECLQHCPSDTRLMYMNLRGKALTTEAFFNHLANALRVQADLADIRQALERHIGPLWLMIDDYPHFPDSALDDLVSELMQSCPSNIAWWIASRRRPQLQLTRLLLDCELFELGHTELSFNAQELCDLLQYHQLHLPDADVHALLDQSQGWCSGVRLHLLKFKAPQPPTPYDPAHPTLMEYLRYEVLDELAAECQEALFTLAQFSCFDRDLCEQVLGMGDGARLVAHLQVCGLFIEASPQRESMLRVQPALAAVLAAQLPAVKVKSVFRKACQWYVSQNNVRMALEYALRADQTDMAANLLQRFTGDAVLQGRSLAQVISWRQDLPEELLTSTPRLLLLSAWALMLSGRLDQAAEYTEQLARFLPQPNARSQHELIAQWKALKANLAFHLGTADQARELLEEAIDELPDKAWSQRLFSCALRLEQALIEGRLDDAQELNRIAIKQARQHGSLSMESVMALGHVKLLEIRGELLRAETLLNRLFSELTDAWGNEPSPMRGRVQLRRAGLLLQQGRYDEAQMAFLAGQHECQRCGDSATIWGYLGLAELDALRGDFNGAFLRLSDAERQMQYNHVNESMYQGLLVRAKARIWLAQGRAAHVERTLAALPRSVMSFSPYGSPELHLRLHLLQLQARLANGAVDDALASLTELYKRARNEGRRTLACEISFTLAEGLYASNKPAQAKQMLLDAVALARQIGLVSVERAFAKRNPALIRWREETLADATTPSELLSRRELDVLKLIAQGHSNQQIAEQLFISLHTVKTHAQRVNVKLGVKRRTQAVARAKELGLT
ncbi:LuxR C-terminal-related transcriptional regulator [Pseudomonas sp. 18058]|uniref:LuxR C-terminal-related transcriptional regulator n=1 Tax=Pseudomonas sp. 18058 TaxID=2681406 RepID=UPI00135962A2|nr:LuxR C-terminal-related transcriptional regulator [Pseudomonas sp. 18058]